MARKDGILPSPLFNWRRHMAEGGKQAIEANYGVVAADEVDRKRPETRHDDGFQGAH